ncbi:MAG: hypothetical protein IM628_10635 [Phenylobacterium sp.]|uniref:hypothetical protein n=1 Tax=Phenylobacterium sp. TaxID=1871053 RepID=UPI0025DCA135|nr:hypothetical protein [Phenylobacterium sp.]MCA6305257.1 hypothetical protein [Phenylobacterium sp.]
MSGAGEDRTGRTALRVRLLAGVMVHRPGASTEALLAEADALWAWAAGDPLPDVGNMVARRPPLTLGIETVAGVDPAARCAPVRRPWSGDRDADPRRAALLAAITAAADRPCPTNEALAAASGYSGAAGVGKVLAKLNRRGAIAIERRPGEAVDSPVRRIRVAATGTVTGWTAAAVGAAADPGQSRREQVLRMLAAAADAGAPCPWNRDVARALGLKYEADVARLISQLVREGRIRVERVGATQRRVTIVATGAATAISLPPPRLGRLPATPRTETTCAPDPTADAGSPATGSPAVPATPSGPSSTTGSSAPASPAGGDRGSTSSGPAGAPPSPISSAVSASANGGTDRRADGSPGTRTSAGSPPPPDGSSSSGTPAPSAGIRSTAPTAVPDRLRPDERAAIEAAVAAGRVRRVPPAASGLRTTKWDVTGAVVDDGDRGPFPDATPEVRAAALALQRAGTVVVTLKPDAFLVNGRETMTGAQLVARAARRAAGARRTAA